MRKRQAEILCDKFYSIARNDHALNNANDYKFMRELDLHRVKLKSNFHSKRDLRNRNCKKWTISEVTTVLHLNNLFVVFEQLACFTVHVAPHKNVSKYILMLQHVSRRTCCLEKCKTLKRQASQDLENLWNFSLVERLKVQVNSPPKQN